MNTMINKRPSSAFGKREWDRFLKLLRDLSGFDFSFFDPSGKRLGHIPSSPPICRLMRRSEAGRKTCEECWKRRIAQARPGEILVANCDAEMTNLVAPVSVGSRFFGYLVGAESRVEGPGSEAKAERRLKKLATKVGIPADKLIAAYQRSPGVSVPMLENRRKTCRRLVQAIAEMLADARLTRIISRVQASARRDTIPQFWCVVGEAAALLVPAERVEILTVAPARDAFVRVWPKPGEPDEIPDESLLRYAEEKGVAVDGSRNLIFPVRLQRMAEVNPSLAAVLRVQPPAGVQYVEVDIRQLTRLAETAGDLLGCVRTRETRNQRELLLAELGKTKNHSERLQIILRICVELLQCSTGDVSLVRPGFPDTLRVAVRYGKGTEQLPYLVAADLGITGRVMSTRTTTVVPRTAQDPDFLAALSDAGRLRSRYSTSWWRIYQDFLRRRVLACVKVPLILGDEILGVMCLHRNTHGVFDLDMVHVVEALAHRAAIEAECLLAVEDSLRRPAVPQGIDSPEELASRFSRFDLAAAKAALGRELAEKVRDMSGAFSVAVRLANPVHDNLTMIALATSGSVSSNPSDWKQVYRAEISLDMDCGATHAFKEQAVHVVEDTAQVGTHYHRFEREARSHLSVRLEAGAEKLGVVSIDWAETGVLNTAMVRRLENLANRYAAAFKLSGVDQGFSDIETHLAEQRKSQQRINYTKVLKIVAAMVGARHGGIFIRRPSTGRYHLAAHLTHPEWSGDEKFYELGEGITGWVAASNRPLRIADLSDREELAGVSPELIWESKHSDYDGEPENLAYLGVPIAVGSEVLGVLRLVFPLRGHFGPNDEQIALAAATRMAGFLYERDEARRADASKELASKGAASMPLKQVAEHVFRALEAGLGDCACHIRTLDKIENERGQVVEVLGRLAVSSPEWEKSPLLRQKKEGIAGRVWETGQTFVCQDLEQEPWIKAAMEEDLATHELLDQKVGSGACIPITVEGQLVGTLHVHKAHRRALSGRDIAFIEEVSHLAGTILDRTDRAEEIDLELRLEKLIDRFLASLLAPGVSIREQEQKLLRGVCDALLAGFGSELGWVRVPDDLNTHFTVLHARGIDAGAIPDLEIAGVLSAGGPKNFLVVSDPKNDNRISKFAEGQEESYRRAVTDADGCAIVLGRENEPLALFSVPMRPPDRISYRRVERASRMLRELGNLVLLGRRFARDIEVIRPLVLLGTLFSSLQHETRSPVANLKGAIDLLTSRTRTQEEMQPILDVMASERDKLRNCLQYMTSLVGLARKPRGRVDLKGTLLAAFKAALPAAGAPLLRTEFPEHPIWVLGIGDYLETAFRMILRNAVEAAEQNGTAGEVLVCVESPADMACSVAIRDNGPGMSPEVLKQALEPYFTTKPTGTGLGLPAAYCIVRCHDGDLHIRSQKGKGTTVTVSLPLYTGDT
ncbi:MAG: GAF domain-containing protein [Planctomycetia bacterium]|nr:GAF domain-containing protein [Planctomycetia bacterium]